MPHNNENGRLVSSTLKFSIDFIPKIESDIEKIKSHIINVFDHEELITMENHIQMNIIISGTDTEIFSNLFDLITHELILKTLKGVIFTDKSHIIKSNFSFYENKEDIKIVFEFINYCFT